MSRYLNKNNVVCPNVETHVFSTHALCGFALRNCLIVFVAMSSVHQFSVISTEETTVDVVDL